MYRKGFVYTASALFILLLLTPWKCWTWDRLLRWRWARWHQPRSSGNGFPPRCTAAHKLTSPVPCFESMWMKQYSFRIWAGKAVMYCTTWVFWLSYSLICRSLYYTALHRPNVSLKKKYGEHYSELWKHEHMITPDIKAGSCTITSNKYGYIFVV